MRITHGKPQHSGLFSLLYKYSSLSETDTPRDYAGLVRILLIWGLDRIFARWRCSLLWLDAVAPLTGLFDLGHWKFKCGSRVTRITHPLR